ncbi:hypothetical protein Riv7116_2337 [Rivularia sp. PCC 7116]|uniref:oligosaccharide repeat unit polymerase n=1 Tax=Rivularia sp. PCC 7116 TaxID=373994 RepID=UPI00029EE302|nr:oligosaccharide repeat unit polymerase [Rivularia sp. PCC 7116]AFY54853.1 hypothetical protein Riv7116_2337 [Rivularia sp. PCC 7116]
MQFVDLLFLFIIPALPLITGISNSLAPLGGPLVIISLQLFLGATLKSLYLIFNKHLFLTTPWLNRSVSAYETAIVFMFLFSFLICFGYLFASYVERKKRLKLKFITSNFNFTSENKSFILLIIGIVSFFIVASIFIWKRGLLGRSLLDIIIGANISKVDKIEGVKNFGNTNAFITIFFVLPRTCFFLFYANVIKNSKIFIYKLGFSVTLILTFMEIILRGKRDAFAHVFLSLLIMAGFIRKKIMLKEIRTYSLFIAVSIFLFSLITYLRGSGTTSIELSNLNYNKQFLEPVLASTYFTDVNILASIIERMENLQFMYGDSYLMFFTGLIPRAFWPDKPAISLGLFVKSQILLRPGTLGGVPPTMPGEAFINFGWYGLGIALLYGYLLRKLEAFLLRGKLAARGIGIYIYSIWIVPLTWSLMQSSFAITMNGVVVSLGIALPLLYFASYKSKAYQRVKILR